MQLTTKNCFYFETFQYKCIYDLQSKLETTIVSNHMVVSYVDRVLYFSGENRVLMYTTYRYRTDSDVGKVTTVSWRYGALARKQIKILFEPRPSNRN